MAIGEGACTAKHRSSGMEERKDYQWEGSYSDSAAGK